MTSTQSQPEQARNLPNSLTLVGQVLDHGDHVRTLGPEHWLGRLEGGARPVIGRGLIVGTGLVSLGLRWVRLRKPRLTAKSRRFPSSVSLVRLVGLTGDPQVRNVVLGVLCRRFGAMIFFIIVCLFHVRGVGITLTRLTSLTMQGSVQGFGSAQLDVSLVNLALSLTDAGLPGNPCDTPVHFGQSWGQV